ncbi:MAG: metallophosphoesterase family protein [Candidatus Thorarchaeota archaeon]
MDFLVLSDIHHCWVHLEKMISIAGDFDGVIFLGDLLIHDSERVVVSEDIRYFSRIYDVAKYMVGVPGNGAIPEIVEYLDDIGVSVHGKSRILADIGFFGVGGTPDPASLIIELRTYFKNDIRPAIELQPSTLETLAIFGVTIRDDVFSVEEWAEKQEKELERFRGPFDHTEENIYNILEKGFKSLPECSFQVLLSHVPPYVPFMNPNFPEGISAGSKGIARFIKEIRPSVVLSGHYHISYKSDINGIPYFICPAVKDGFYSILNIGQDTKECKVTLKKF